MQIPTGEIVQLVRSPSIEGLYDVDLSGVDQLRRCSSVDCHVVVYPYSRRLSAAEIKLNPFEEYVRDILSLQRSAYVRISSDFDKLFGFLLGGLITLVFVFCNPGDLLSVESVVSILGAFFIGKELWDDIDGFLVRLTRSWPIRYQQNYYSYRLERHTTLTQYSRLAKRQRYGKTTLLPELMDFIAQSNSQTVRMRFERGELASQPDGAVHVLSLSLDPSQAREFEQGGFLLGVKLSLNRRLCGVECSTELFQSLDKGTAGCLDNDGAWHDGAVFCRRTVSVGRLKWFIGNTVLASRRLVTMV